MEDARRVHAALSHQKVEVGGRTVRSGCRER
jgi:hypothetical protein